MIIIRLFLYLICVVSIGWSVLIFCGPFFITRIIQGYTDGAIIPSDVTVSPSLGINIGRLDFTIKNEKLGIPIEGFSRSTEILWSFDRQKPFIDFNFGPSVLKNYATAENINIFTRPYRNISWQNMSLAASIEKPSLNSVGQAESINIKGEIDFLSSNANDVELEVNSLSAELGGSTISSSLLNGQISNFNFENPLKNQVFSGNVLVKDVGLLQPNLSFPEAVIKIAFNETSKNFKIDLYDFQTPKLSGTIENIKASGSYDQNYVLNDFDLNFFSGTFAENLPSFSDISSRIFNVGDGNYKGHIEGNLVTFEMSNSENFLGVIPPSSFKIDLQLDKKTSTVISDSKINFENVVVSNIDASASLQSEPGKLSSIGCAFSDCELPNFDLIYKFNFNYEWISGRTYCSKVACDLADINFEIKTSDTINLFKSLNQAGILSPLSSMYLYGIVGSGKKIKNGHELKFHF